MRSTNYFFDQTIDDRFLSIYEFDYKMSKPNDQILVYLNKKNVDLIKNNLYHFDK